MYNIPIACNRATADFMISSPLMDEEYHPAVTDYSAYLGRNVQIDATNPSRPEDTLEETRQPGLDIVDGG